MKNKLAAAEGGLKERSLVHIDFLRIIAVYLVMFNHTGKKGFSLFTVSENSPFFLFYLFIAIADKIAVPVFFMISGALLLGKDESIADVYKKRLLKFFTALTAASGFYYLYYNLPRVTGRVLFFKVINIKNFLELLYTGNISLHLWYMYQYIGILILLPLLRKMIRNMAPGDYKYFFLCYILICGIAPPLQYLLSTNADVELRLEANITGIFFASKNIVYFIMGYYYEKVVKESEYNRRNLLKGIILSIAAIGFSCFMTIYKAHITGEMSEETSQTFFENLIAIPAFTAYFCAKYAFMKIKVGDTAKKYIAKIGSATFGVYLFERVIRENTAKVAFYYEDFIGALPASLLWIAVCLMTGTLITLLLKKIPVIKNYL